MIVHLRLKQDVYVSLPFDSNTQAEKIASHENEVASLKQFHENFVQYTEIYLDGLQQYGGRNCLLFS